MFSTQQENFNPFEQNSSVIAGFFKKPIILILAIVQMLFGSCYLVSFVLNHFLLTTFQFRPAFFFDLLSIALYTPMAVGYIMVYIKSKDANTSASLQNGFKVLHITTIAKFVLCILSIAFACLTYNNVTSTINDFLGDSFFGSMLSFISSILLFIVIAFIVIALLVVVLFYMCQIRFFSNIKKSLTTISITHKGTKLFAAFNIILAIFAVVGAFGSLAEHFSGDANASIRALMPTITLVLASVLFICNTVMALSYRKYIKQNVFGFANLKTDEDESTEVMGVDASPVIMPQPVQHNYKTYADLAQQKQATCPYCNNSTSADTIFCSSCGKKIR